MSNSSFVAYTNFSPNNYGQRTQPITRITPHCTVGQIGIESLGVMFANPAQEAASNYGIGYDGRVGMYVPENKAAWCSSNYDNDSRAVTIECASDSYEPYSMSNNVWLSLIALCVDICQRNNKSHLLWITDKDKALAYQCAPNEMLLTIHRWFAATACPGDWLYDRLSELAGIVTERLQSVSASAEESSDLYRVQVGAFRIRENAESYRDELVAKGYPDAFIVTIKDYFKE